MNRYFPQASQRHHRRAALKMRTFARLELAGWRQFAEVSLDLNQQVTVLTGQNGCGKTTILNSLARHFGWNIQFVSTPFWGKKKKERFWSDVYHSREDELEPEAGTKIVGTIEYGDGTKCTLRTNSQVGAQYKLQYENQQEVVGLHIPSHRPTASYHKVENIPTDPKTGHQHYQAFQQLLFQTYGSERSQNPGIAQKESIISLAVFGYGNDAVAANPEYREIFEGFQSVLVQVLPPELGFKKLEVRMPDVVLVTETGEFALEAMSGGINALFGVAWQIHLYGAGKDGCTVTFDEPENHLHPSMQRSLLPSLARAFPKYRFVVATHSPFIVSSFPESAVYGLIYDNEKRVLSQRLEARDLSGTPNRVLREILDVPSNLPIWVEDQIRRLLQSVADQPPEERARVLFALLKELGLTDAISEFQGGGYGA